jgi:hypothetical protein
MALLTDFMLCSPDLFKLLLLFSSLTLLGINATTSNIIHRNFQTHYQELMLSVEGAFKTLGSPGPNMQNIWTL